MLYQVGKEDYVQRLRAAARTSRFLHSRRVVELPAVVRGLLAILG
jgi:hypothetical protein